MKYASVLIEDGSVKAVNLFSSQSIANKIVASEIYLRENVKNNDNFMASVLATLEEYGVYQSNGYSYTVIMTDGYV